MKRFIFILWVSFCFVKTEAQNLVPNWSFEDTLPNPTWSGFILTDCALWQSPVPPGSAAYLNDYYLFNPGIASLYQVPHTGVAYALMYTNTSLTSISFPACPDCRQILQIQLTDTLQAGKKYCVSFLFPDLIIAIMPVIILVLY